MDAEGEWDRLPIERQVWLLCRDTAARRSRKWHDMISRVAYADSGFGVDLLNEARGDRLSAMQFAAGDLVPRLTDAERADVREQRTLPDWFVPEMVRAAKSIERELRRDR